MAAEPSPPRSRPPLVWPRGIRRRDSPSARSIANQMVLSHLGKTRFAELMINKREECRHDRTPLFDQCGKLDWQLFQGSFAARQKWLLQRENCFDQNALKESAHGFVGTRCKLAGPSLGKMRSYIARAS